jgi:glycosyltransferase involved in cell wall biosynthesis
MRIAYIGDMAQTGFGRVGKELCRRFVEAGHDLRAIGINFDGREGAVGRAMKKGLDGEAIRAAFDEVAMDPVLSRTIPAMINGNGMGHDLTAPLVEGRFIRGWKPERVLFTADPVAALERLATDGGALASVPTYNYVPIEGSDLSVFWRAIWEDVTPVAMSRFGQRELQALLARDDVPYIPHGMSDTFHRITPERPAWTSDGTMVTSKAEAKAVHGWEGRTVILRTDRFVDRKGYPDYFDVIRDVIADRPEVVFVIHCAPIDEGGLMPLLLADLPGAANGTDGWTHEQVRLTRAHDTFRGLTDAQLNILINAADVVASTSSSEGFGLTLAEAAACGVPVVANDFAAIPEAIGLGGLLIDPLDIVPTRHGHHWAETDVERFTEALMSLVDDPALRLDLGAKGEAHVARFDWDKAALDFLRLMEERPRWRL